MKKICYIVTIPITIKAFFIPQLQYLAEHGYEVHVICSSDSSLQKILGEKIKYIPVDMARGISISGTIKAIRELTEIFRKEKYDLIQYSTPNAALNAAIAGKISKIKVRNYHCMGFRYLGFQGIIRFIFKLLEKITCFISTDIECVSQSNLELGIMEKIFKKEKVTVIFNGSTGGVNLEKFSMKNKSEWRKEIRRKYKIKNEDFVYGFVGRITKDKGIDELIEAFLGIDNDAKLFLVGEIEENNKLNLNLLQKVEENKNVIFAGKSTEVEKFYAAIDVLVLPSYREGFGNVVIEAEAMGIPVIVSDIPGPRDTMVKGQTGYLVECKNVNDLRTKMQQIREKEIYDNFSMNAYQFAKTNFDSRIINKYIWERKELLIGKNYGS